MAPTFRSSRSGRQFDSANRTRTGQIDHDVFEGLPVRRWTRQRQTITQQPKTEQKSIMQGPDGKHILPEFPMPRDSQLLSPTSRALLRAARAGCIYIRNAPKEHGEKEANDPAAAEAEESHATHMANKNFVARKWTAVPRHMEPPEVEFLAKRRAGLPSLYGAAAMGAVGSGENGVVPMRKTRFMRVDQTTGNISVYDAWVPEGLRIEGETTEDTQAISSANGGVHVTPETPASGTVIEGVGAVNSEGVVVAEAGSVFVLPPKRRPPPPKRKGKGIGRGRRKKVMFAPGEGADSNLVHGAGAGPAEGAAGTDLTKDGADASRLSVDQSGQEEEEEEGEEGEESDDGDESMVDAKTPETPVQQGAETSGDAHEPAAESDAGSKPPPGTPVTGGETPSQPPHPSEVSDRANEEKSGARDVNMNEPDQVADALAPEGMTAEPENAVQPPSNEGAEPESTGAPVHQELPSEPTEKPFEPVPETEQAQPDNETANAMPPDETSENNDADAGGRGTGAENTVDENKSQPEEQVDGKPTTQAGESESKENEPKGETENQTAEHIEAPSGEQQSTEQPSEPTPAQPEIKQEQPADQTSTNHPEPQPEHEEEEKPPKQESEHEEPEQTSHPRQAPADSTSGDIPETENQPKPDPEPSVPEADGHPEEEKGDKEGEEAESSTAQT